MLNFSDAGAPFIKPLTAETVAGLSKANKGALNFVTGAQKIMMEETAFACNEMFERIRTETHLWSEFISKMSGSHSVKDLKGMFEGCSQHQIEFVRRDCERVFKHSERMLEATTNLLSGRQS